MAIRSVEDIIESLRNGLISLGSPLARFNPFGNLYSIFRSISIVVSEQDNELSTLQDGFFILTAKGIDLDRRALDYSLFRRGGSNSNGFVLASIKPSTVVTNYRIPEGLLLRDANQTLEFRTLKETFLLNGEVVIPIESTTRSSNNNLTVGTPLYSSLFSYLSFTVGNYRSNNRIAGSITNGVGEESDESFRSRILTHLTNLGKGTVTSLKNEILGTGLVSRVEILEHSPLTGYISIFIDTNNNSIVNSLRDLIEETKPVGVSYIIKPFNYSNIPVGIILYLSKSTVNINNVIDEVRNKIIDYTSNLGVGDNIDSNTIAGLAIQVDGVNNCSVISPSPLDLQDTVDSSTILKVERIDVEVVLQ